MEIKEVQAYNAMIKYTKGKVITLH